MAQVMTVLGPIADSELGVTLPHEHLILDLSCYLERPRDNTGLRQLEEPVSMANLARVKRNPYGNRDDCLLLDVDLAVAEARLYAAAGGRTIVDLTNDDLGRDPLALQRIARLTGLNIVMGCGHYLEMAHPASLAALTVEQLAEEMVAEIEHGVGGTGVRPGIIGEIGSGDPVTPAEAKVLEAAARAQRQTGLPISVHIHPPGRRGHEVLDLLETGGADLRSVVLGHLDAAIAHPGSGVDDAVAYHRSLAERGCFIEYDLCGNDGYFATSSASWWLPSDRERAIAIKVLVDMGFGGQLLLSQDVGHKHYLTQYGGWGYGHVPSTFATILQQAGLSLDAIRTMLVENPRRLLAR